MESDFFIIEYTNIMQQDILEKLAHLHHELFSTQDKLRYFFAPGRINLIGEHIDYNGGHVLPCALDIGTYASVTPRADNKFRFYSANFPDFNIIEFGLDELINHKEHGWANYPKGVIKGFIDNHYNILHGLDICILGNIPNGAGLSSSASIEVLMSIILNSVYGLNVDRVTMARISQAAENKFIGVNCGIMDQFASILGRKSNALLLNCQTLNYEYVPLDLTGYKLVIANTNKPRKLAESKYNERCFECNSALTHLQKGIAVKMLCDLNPELLAKYLDLIPDIVWQKRVKHVVTENMRTLNSITHLNQGDLKGFGKLLNQSHLSLKDDYEVTCVELDTMANLAWEFDGCIGSRMTGAGFGGCTISIIKDDLVEDFIASVGSTYQKLTKLVPAFYVATTADGAMELTD